MMLTWLSSVLRSAGLTVVETDGWETRGYKGWIVVPRVVVLHHTAEPTGYSRPEAMARLLIRGRSDLPGPLCQCYVDRQGRWWLIAAGYANHAGRGQWAGVATQSLALGIEIANDGIGELYPDRQVESVLVGTAAITKHARTLPAMVCAHREWAPRRKTDPKGLSMTWIRSQVADLMKGGEMAQFTEDQADILRRLAAGAGGPVEPWAADAWQQATDLGMVDGSAPGGPVTRQMMVVAVLRLLERLDLIGDREVSEWAREARDALVARGVTDGERPGQPLRREEAWTMASRLHR